MLIGTIINVLLYGMMICQVYLYQRASARDPTWIKLFVALIFVADTVHTVFTVVYMYDTLILHFGDFPFLEKVNWFFSTDPALTGIIGGLVQAFFAWRIKVLTGSYLLPGVVGLCSIITLLMGIATAIACGIVQYFTEFLRFKVVVILWLGSSAVADLIIATTLSLYLNRNKTGFSRTDTQIDRIIRLTIETGLLTAITALIDLLLFLLDPTGLHLLFNFPLSKLYSNSLMSTLNARALWNNEIHDPTPSFQDRFDRERTTLHLSSLKPNVNINSDRRVNTEVFVKVESHHSEDGPEKGSSNASMGGKSQIDVDLVHAV